MLNIFKLLGLFIALFLASACQMSGGNDGKNSPDIDPDKKIVLKEDMLTLPSENIFWNVSSPSKTLQFSLSKDYGNPKDTKYNIKVVALDGEGHETTSTCLKVADFTIQGNNTVSVPVTGIVQKCTDTLGFYVNNVKQQQKAKFYIATDRMLEFSSGPISFLDDTKEDGNLVTLKISGMIADEPDHEIMVTSTNTDIRFIEGATETTQAKCKLSYEKNTCDLKYKLATSSKAKSVGFDPTSFKFIANGSNINLDSPDVKIYHCDGSQKLYFDDEKVGLKNGLFSTKLVYCPTTDDTEHSILFSESSGNIKLPTADSIKVSADKRVVDVDFSLTNANNVSTLKDPTPAPKALFVTAELDKKDSGIQDQIILQAVKPVVTISQPLITLHKGGGTATATVSCSGTIIGSSINVRFKNNNSNFSVTPTVNLSNCSGPGKVVTITTKTDAKTGSYDLFDDTKEYDYYVVNEKDKAHVNVIDLPNISVSPDHVNLHSYGTTEDNVYAKSFYLIIDNNIDKNNIYLKAPVNHKIDSYVLKDATDPNSKESCDIVKSDSVSRCQCSSQKCVFIISVPKGAGGLTSLYENISVLLADDNSLLKEMSIRKEAVGNKFAFSGIKISSTVTASRYPNGLIMTNRVSFLHDSSVVANANSIIDFSNIENSSNNIYCSATKVCDISLDNYNLQTYDSPAPITVIPKFDLHYDFDQGKELTCSFTNFHLILRIQRWI